MKPGRLFLVFAVPALLAGCQSTPTPDAPPSSAAALSSSGSSVDAKTLETGRTLFIARCTKCHVLPKVADHSAAQWPGLVAQMAKRSGLKPAQSEAMVAYILAARASEGR